MVEKSTNPYVFITNLRVPVIQVIKDVKKDEDTGEYLIDEYFFEAADYNRIYTSPTLRNSVFSLSEKARDLYLMMLYMMNADYEYIIMSYKKVNELYRSTGAKKDLNLRVFKETMKELVAHTILDLKDKAKEQYWINPNYFFQGDRSKKWPDNMVIVQTIDNRSAFQKSLTTSVKFK